MSDQDLKEMLAKLIQSQAKTDEQIRELKGSQAKTDEQLVKTDEQLSRSEAAFDRRIKKLEQLVGGIGNNQGDVAEEYFVNSLREKLELLGKKFDILIPNFTIQKKNIIDEYDILLVNGSELAMIEVKYKLHQKDIEKLERKIANLKALPQYRNYTVYAGVAGFNVPVDVIESANEKGYFVLQRNGNVIETYAEELRAA